MSGYLLSPQASADLSEIWGYYADDIGDVDLADRIFGEIISGINLVAKTPVIGHLRSDLADEPLRFWHVRIRTTS